MRIAIKTLGCKVNQSESASIEGALRQNGHEIVPSLQDNPDICIINTCTVTAKSDYQSRQFIRRAVKSGAKVIATGCYAQLRPDELTKIQGIDLILGNSQKDKIHKYLDKLSPKFPQLPENPPISPFNKGGQSGIKKGGSGDFRTRVLIDSPETPLQIGPYYSNRTRAFLKIQDGCNFSCTYCTVPMARGKSRSLSQNDVLKTVEKLSAQDYKEIVLTGIHIGCYGLELQPESSLLKIVKKIIEARPQIRIRLSSVEPQEFDKDFLMLIRHGTVCQHVHIPLQSGSDKILKAMNRKYSTAYYKELINDIISACPNISIGTDIIAGFPGETEKDFEDTIRFLDELPLSYIHVFPYSKRPDTKAAELKTQVKKDAKKNRVIQILEISKIKKNAYITKQLGQRLDVIVEQSNITNGLYRAISDNYIRLLVRSGGLVLGQRMQVHAVSVNNEALICVPV